MEHTLPLFRCSACGFPRILSTLFNWKSNGTITAHPLLWGSNLRVVFYRQGFVANLFSSIEQQLGLSIDHIAFEAERQASIAVFQSVLDRTPFADRITRTRLMRRIWVYLSDQVAMVIGAGHSRTLKYVPGKYSTGEIKNPYNRNLLGAVVAGDFELIEKKPLKVSWEELDNDSYKILVEVAESYSDISDRMSPDLPDMSLSLFPSQQKRSDKILPGGFHHERCPRCKTPTGLTSLKWTEEEGTIIDMENQVRFFLIDAYFIPTVFRELARELGDDAYNMIIDSVKEYTLMNPSHFGFSYESKPRDIKSIEEALRKHIFSLPLYGEGNPVDFKMTGSSLDVTVENPYEPLIIAATTKGLFEWLHESTCSMDWSTDKRGVLQFSLNK